MDEKSWGWEKDHGGGSHQGGSVQPCCLLYYCSNLPCHFPQLRPTCKIIWTPNPQPSFPPNNSNGFILSFIRAWALPLSLNYKLVPV